MKVVSSPATLNLSPDQACVNAIAIAEVKYGIPQGLLLAIAQVESGRLDAQSGRIRPWPWTIDVGGQGAFFTTRTRAIEAVEMQLLLNVRSIDLGCLQINMQQHPDAFPSLDQAFEPKANADYAARFLLDLQRESGDWATAAGLYHSRTEALATPYRAAVVARYVGTGNLMVSVIPQTPKPVDLLATAWAATLPHNKTQELHLWPTAPVPPALANIKTPRAIRLAAR